MGANSAVSEGPYSAVKAYATARNYPVYGVSETGAETDNVGIQCGIRNSSCPGAAAVTLMPQGTTYWDYANAHNYIIGGQPVVDNMAWGRQTRLWLAAAGMACMPDSGKQGRTITKDIRKPSCPVYQGSQRKLGGARTTSVFIPIFISRNSSAAGQSPAFMRWWISKVRPGDPGFFTTTNTAKPSATHLHNLTTVIRDTANFTAGGLTYTIPAEATRPTVHDLLLQKANGTFYLIVWDERPIGEGTDSVTVNLGTSASGAVYDTTVGTSPVSTFTNVTSVALTMADHPMIVRVGP